MVCSTTEAAVHEHPKLNHTHTSARPRHANPRPSVLYLAVGPTVSSSARLQIGHVGQALVQVVAVLVVVHSDLRASAFELGERLNDAK